MPTKSQEMEDLTLESQELKPQFLRPSVTSFQPTNAKIQSVERFPESTTHATFIPHPLSPLVKAKVKHLEDGFPTIKGDPRTFSFLSQYNDTFKRLMGQPAQPVEKHCSSVCIGNPTKSTQRETTYTASYLQPPVCRPQQTKDQLVFKPRNFYKDCWTTTFREDFKSHKHEPVVQVQTSRNVTSVSRGDTDKERNAERMSVTTNKFFFSDPIGPYSLLCLPDPDMITKSQVHFGPTSPSGQSYTTTTSEQYNKKEGGRAKPAINPRSNILSGPEHGPHISTSMADYIPLKSSKQGMCQTQQKTNLKFPLSKTHFSTTHSEDYTAKPLILQRSARDQFCSHFMLK
ncbi:uncharacterized protein LOC124874360 [Girardinichthys multiradiatus]|uniref:uncharacterized protein LOC124874360 n=1 Tax=Girardinichthys multiradiatus TaxID=208333 RepID=UPI001FAE53B9|nr:uncharacterized protein LOC124874360 [Girardinichthys multiradiatus]